MPDTRQSIRDEIEMQRLELISLLTFLANDDRFDGDERFPDYDGTDTWRLNEIRKAIAEHKSWVRAKRQEINRLADDER